FLGIVVFHFHFSVGLLSASVNISRFRERYPVCLWAFDRPLLRKADSLAPCLPNRGAPVWINCW
ncbi:MAG: hypothetical protein OEV06_09495, partial [Anaerolineae bacterium]|nr:hypothetical protein [Anaerolineae bacterium]